MLVGLRSEIKKCKAEKAAAISTQKIDTFFHPQSNSEFTSDGSQKSDRLTVAAGPSNKDEPTVVINDESNHPSIYEGNLPSSDNFCVLLSDSLCSNTCSYEQRRY